MVNSRRVTKVFGKGAAKWSAPGKKAAPGEQESSKGAAKWSAPGKKAAPGEHQVFGKGAAKWSAPGKKAAPEVSGRGVRQKVASGTPTGERGGPCQWPPGSGPACRLTSAGGVPGFAGTPL